MLADCLLSFCYSAQVKVFVEGLFFLNNNITAFKEHLRDFLVQIKVVKFCLLVAFVYLLMDLFVTFTGLPHTCFFLPTHYIIRKLPVKIL